MHNIDFYLRLTHYTSFQNCVYTVQQREEGECPHGQLTAQGETAVKQRLEEGACMVFQNGMCLSPICSHGYCVCLRHTKTSFVA